MTKTQCVEQVMRMKEIMKGTPGPGQLNAYYENFRNSDIRDFSQAVGDFLFKGFPPRSPNEFREHVCAHEEARLEREKTKRDQESKRFFQGGLRVHSPDPIGESFQKLCYAIIRLGPRKSAVKIIPDWLNNHECEEWAKKHMCRDEPQSYYDWLRGLVDKYDRQHSEIVEGS